MGDYEYLIFVSLYTDSTTLSLNDLNPKVSIISHVESLNVFDLYMPSLSDTEEYYGLWVIGCFNGKKGLQYFQLINEVINEDFGVAYVQYCSTY